MITKILQWVVAAAVIYFTVAGGVHTIKKHGFKKLSRDYERLRLIDFLLGFVVAWTTITIIVFLMRNIEFLGWGWWSLLGGTGNPMFGGHKDLPKPLSIPLQFFLVLLVFATMPPVVRWEEKKFRLGAQKRSFLKNLKISFYFGMIHCVCGVPLGAGLGLTFVGLYYTAMYLWTYRKTRSSLLAYRRSLRAHLGYNAVIMFTLFCFFLYRTYEAII